MNAKVEQLISPPPMQDASFDIWQTKYQLKTKTGAAVDQDINSTYDRAAKALSSVEYKNCRFQSQQTHHRAKISTASLNRL